MGTHREKLKKDATLLTIVIFFHFKIIFGLVKDSIMI